MRHLILLISFLALLLTVAIPSSAQVSILCGTGDEFGDGVEIRLPDTLAGEYIITAIGLNGFDPILAVSYTDGFVECYDNVDYAADYAASLPTTGEVEPSFNSAQALLLPPMEDIESLVVGGYENTTGSFLLIIEGTELTPDSADAFAVQVTPGMVESGVPLAAYLFAAVEDINPMLAQVDGSGNIVMSIDGTPVS